MLLLGIRSNPTALKLPAQPAALFNKAPHRAAAPPYSRTVRMVCQSRFAGLQPTECFRRRSLGLRWTTTAPWTVQYWWYPRPVLCCRPVHHGTWLRRAEFHLWRSADRPDSFREDVRHFSV